MGERSHGIKYCFQGQPCHEIHAHRKLNYTNCTLCWIIAVFSLINSIHVIYICAFVVTESVFYLFLFKLKLGIYLYYSTYSMRTCDYIQCTQWEARNTIVL